MNKKKKALLLASIASLSILCGCTTSAKTIETEDGTYVESNGEYVKVNVDNKIFEVGEHKIAYAVTTSGTYTFNKGWINLYSYMPEIPEGYELTGVATASSYKGYTDAILFTFTNIEKVEVEGVYNSKLNIVEYPAPGTVIKDKTLELGE